MIINRLYTHTHTHTHIYIYIYIIFPKLQTLLKSIGTQNVMRNELNNLAVHSLYTHTDTHTHIGPVGWSCRIHQLYLCRRVRLLQRVSGYDTKLTDGEVPVMLVLRGTWSKSLVVSLLVWLWPRVVALDRVLSIGQIEINCVLLLN